jgi:hypothetical protein
MAHVDSLIRQAYQATRRRFGDPLRLVSQRVNLETGFSRITNGSASWRRADEGSRAGLVRCALYFLTQGAGILVTLNGQNLFLTEAPPRKGS